MRWQKIPRPELPFPDRREHRRYLTKKNVLMSILIVFALFAVITIRSEMRSTPADEYGRVYGKQLKKVPETAPRAPMPVVTEATPIPESPSADPFALDAARREQYLGDTTLTPAPAQSGTVTIAGVAQPGPSTQSNVRVEGGPEGVAIVQDNRPDAPVLGGGFGRP